MQPLELKGKIRRNNGAYKESGMLTTEMVCLFGLDALEKLGGKLEINMKDKIGKIII